MASYSLVVEEKEHAVNEDNDSGDKGLGMPGEPVQHNEYDY